MKLYDIGKIGSVTVFYFGAKKLRSIKSGGPPRRILGFRISEQRGSLYLEVPGGAAFLIKGDKVVILFGKNDDSLAMTGALQVLSCYSGKCSILNLDAEYVIYATSGDTRAWEGTAGDGKVRRGVHPQTKEID